MIGRIRSLPRPLALSLRNTFRRKVRVALTLLALAGGGVMFVMMMSVSTSFGNTLDALLSDFGFDTTIVLERPYSAARLTFPFNLNSLRKYGLGGRRSSGSSFKDDVS